MRFFVALSISAAVILVGDIANSDVAIDCGSSDKFSHDQQTGQTYSSDDGYIDSGINKEVNRSYIYDDLPALAHNLRSFPDGIRNCYTINDIVQGSKYLVRASFLYGNYDEKDSAQITFDLYLGGDLWQTMNITETFQLYTTEMITLATSDRFFVCLISTSGGTPFISALELTFIPSEVSYDVSHASSLRLLQRTNMGSNKRIRRPDDIYDRIWFEEYRQPRAFYRSVELFPYMISITSEVNVTGRDPFEVPSELMQTASRAHDNSTLTLLISDEYTNGAVPPIFYIYLHFAELEMLEDNNSREFQVVIPGVQNTPSTRMKNIRPEYLVATNISIIHQYGSDPSTYYVNLTKAPGSTHPPILNAVEVYTYVNLASIATNQGDVDAMMSIKMQVKMHVKTIWQGDPCVPANFSWKNIICDYSSIPPRVISLNLSNSGLDDSIPEAIANLTAIKYLDLSYNSFTGRFPLFLTRLRSLRFLNLSNNMLEDYIPIELCNRQVQRLLELSLYGNPCISSGLCVCKKQMHATRSIAQIIVPVVVVPLALLIVLLVFLLWRTRRKRQQHLTRKKKLRYLAGSSFHTDNPRFTHQDLRIITNNFERVIGKGGFGTVYYGRLPDGTEVAVKMQRRFIQIGEGNSEDLIADRITNDSHGIKEFQAEAQLLSRVHHRNLVSLVGYCKDGNSLGLVFEYVSQGSLRNHLSETENGGKIFNWRERLRIAIDAAQGLEYLHKGCKPPIIHRDVKTSNILLSHNFEAKIADFGLSKAFLTDAHTHVSTEVVAGTPGYVDPEYHNTFRLSEKSDVYSFGIVLLELVTGLPAVLKLSEEASHILQWVRQRLINGNVADVADPRLKCQYDVHSIRMVTDLALHCTALDGNVRPTMTEVVMQLKGSLQLEMLRENSGLISHGESLYSSTSCATEITSLGISELSGPSAR